MQDTDLWSWSETFLENLEGLMRDPQSYRAVRADWPRHRQRLEWWRHQVDVARERYSQGQAEALRTLYEYWRLIAEDVRDQARVACETFHQLNFCPST
jgi:hypothetical protein